MVKRLIFYFFFLLYTVPKTNRTGHLFKKWMFHAPSKFQANLRTCLNQGIFSNFFGYIFFVYQKYTLISICILIAPKLGVLQAKMYWRQNLCVLLYIHICTHIYIHIYIRRQNYWLQSIFAHNTPNFGAINMKIDMYVYFCYTKNV